MTNRKIKRISLVNLLVGYFLSFCFLFILFFNRADTTELASSIKEPKILFTEINSTKTEKEYIYVPPLPEVVYHDRLHRPLKGSVEPVLVGDATLFIDDTLFGTNVASDTLTSQRGIDYEISKNNAVDHLRPVDINPNRRLHNFHDRVDMDARPDEQVDRGLLDRRLAEHRDGIFSSDFYAYNEAITRDKLDADSFSLDNPDAELNLSKLTLHRDGDDTELGDIDLNLDGSSKAYGTGKGGELYAYNFPSQGVGAGIGSAGLGAGAGGGAGLGAGIGEGVLNGETVPTLGGVGTAPSSYGGSAGSGGVGGLVGGAGAGGAAGLTQGYVANKLGLGPGKAHGGYGGGGEGRGYNHDHLPKDGALHIMMHVDGS